MYVCHQGCSWTNYWPRSVVPMVSGSVQNRRAFIARCYALWAQSIPSCPFEARNVFQRADKPQLAHTIIDHLSNMSSEAITDSAPRSDHYVLDGGSLLHRLPWKTGNSYSTIAQSFTDFTIRHYGSATVVFDGYVGGPSIKNNTHQRHGQNIHPVVNFTEETEFSGKKSDFLSRDSNKQRLIDFISDELRKRGYSVINASGDADVEIVMAAVESSYLHSTTLHWEDTDLLVLLHDFNTVN